MTDRRAAALPFPCIVFGREAPEMAGPGDEIAAGAGGGSYLRAPHADQREQVIDVLKAAFVQGRLTKDEFDARVGQALASRTRGDLAAVTADIPAGVARGWPPRTSVDGRTRKPINKVKVIARGACVICALAVVGVTAAVLISNPYLLVLSGLALIGASAVAWGAMVEVWVQKRSHGRLTQGPAPGDGSRASQRPRPAAEAEQLPQINHDKQEQAEAVQNPLPRRQRRSNSWPSRQWRPRGLPTARRTIAYQAVELAPVRVNRMAAGRSSMRIRLALCGDMVLKNRARRARSIPGPTPSRPRCNTSIPSAALDQGRPRCSGAARSIWVTRPGSSSGCGAGWFTRLGARGCAGSWSGRGSRRWWSRRG